MNNHVDYIHYNPVKHGYTKNPADWHWTSYHDYLERGLYDKEWGCATPEYLIDDNIGME